MALFVLSEQLLMSDDVRKFTEDPVEQRLIEDFLYILEKMELNNELFCYLDVYEILGQNGFDARKIQEQLMLYLQERHLNYEKKRLQTVTDYRNYTYMKRKWKSFLKREKRREPSWEEIVDRIDHFFSPIWVAAFEDRLYIGDWMPELNRYL